MQLDCDKCRSKALKLASQEKGVSSVALEGDDRDQLVVTGKVDAVCLVKVLRKKFKCVNLVSVQELKEKDDNKRKQHNNNCVCYYTTLSAPPSAPYCYYPVYYNSDPSPHNCSIM
ncbi:heavy metal-associated isoprenylated plant protein 47-like [Arachis duranensis]|uniref:Heavy metal-associated isoprenylated plant protein 47-like n=1 Tax=Arachis duranensis TaxID=130453 RepID=A0A6P4DGN2_ARADU|nr:heavy metal-associated isoprenylated plant protein 47-like [Arachis duranensis]